ncbi:ankyrin repeat and LEM domain-containing protein 2-like protein [Leptotrombidium deliense]|uniref:Ankyrin repeat and LEM domain-containing protein 2-like protein n=1 Tax=Leptotrombidium deliense TaxID=299467 RepID=A0A443SUA6_9ACAR|nr:ankyrin repeat and LEM domain-containing protein 2-like protein [Leptotrombidium deliense]
MASDTISPEKRQFYAIASPKHCNVDDKEELVFTEKREVLDALKKFKGIPARFKVFDKFDDAVEYCRKGLDEDNDAKDKKVATDAERASSGGFRAPDPPQLSRLRKMIESSNFEEVKQIILSNPRFLVSCGDTPVILMEGPLDTIKDPSFMRMLYPVDDEITTNNRINQLLDKYLNTPDKAANDTPLHFASKFGSTECVKILLSQNCDVNVVNKMGKKPREVICERKGDNESRYCIQNLFQARYYVPLFRNANGVCIGTPCTEVPHDDTVKAFAGPMSSVVAEEFYNNLRSPATRANREELSIRLSDCHKGVERIARSICKVANISWAEYWPFLGCNVDLTSSEGLIKLEKHLQSVHTMLSMKSNQQLADHFDSFCEKLENLKLSETLNLSDMSESSESPEIFFTAPTSPEIDTEYFVDGFVLLIP